MENIIGRKLNLLPAASMSWFPTKKLLTKGVRRKRPGESLSQILSSSIIGSEVAESISKMALVLFHYRLESTHIQNVWELVWKFKSASYGLWKDKTSQAFKRVIVN